MMPEDIMDVRSVHHHAIEVDGMCSSLGDHPEEHYTFLPRYAWWVGDGLGRVPPELPSPTTVPGSRYCQVPCEYSQEYYYY